MSKWTTNSAQLGGCDTLAGDQQIEDRIFANVADGFPVGDHCEIVAIALQYLVVYSQTGFGRSAFVVHFGHIDTLEILAFHRD